MISVASKKKQLSSTTSICSSGGLGVCDGTGVDDVLEEVLLLLEEEEEVEEEELLEDVDVGIIEL